MAKLKKSNKISFDYFSKEELNNICEALKLSIKDESTSKEVKIKNALTLEAIYLYLDIDRVEEMRKSDKV